MKTLVANFKMNLTKEEIEILKDQLNKLEIKKLSVILCPSYIYLWYLKENLIKKNYNIASQDVSKYTNGAYTGDISSKQLKSLDINYSLVGHIERKKNNKETKNDIILKINNLQEKNIIPIICISEKYEKIRQELNEILSNIKQKEIIIAFEPENSIGTGNVLSNEEINDNISCIKEILGQNKFSNYKLLYGGSINKENVINIIKNNNLDGILVGTISSNIKDFIELIKEIEEIL